MTEVLLLCFLLPSCDESVVIVCFCCPAVTKVLLLCFLLPSCDRSVVIVFLCYPAVTEVLLLCICVLQLPARLEWCSMSREH